MNVLNIHPKQLFLLDGIGALVSAFFLGVVLVYLENSIGMPRKALYFLAFLPILFAIYSLSCAFFLNKKWANYLRIIAFANLAYCILSIGFVGYFFQELSRLGVLYFGGELMIVVCLAMFELKIANRVEKSM